MRWSSPCRRGATTGLAGFLLAVQMAHAVPGLPLIWQRLYNDNVPFSDTDPNHAPEADPDGDGWSNLRESIAGTDPFSADPESGYIQPVCIPHPWLRGIYRLSWPVQMGKEYQVMVSQDLVSWVPIGDKIPGGEYPVQLDLEPELAGGGSPPRLFWRVVVSDPPAPGGPFTPWELNVLFSRPDIRHAVTQGIDGGGAGSETNSDGVGPTDLFDASPYDSKINWEKLPPVRYLWLPASGQGVAVDMNDQGKILYQLPYQTITDFGAQPVGVVWDPSKPPAQRIQNVFMNPGSFQLNMWQAEYAPTPVKYDIPEPGDEPVASGAIWPPVSDETSHAEASVRMRAIGDDGSLAADVYYSLSEHFEEGNEAQRRYVAGDYVFVWEGDSYASCRLVGAGRGFQGSNTAHTRNWVAGFYQERVNNQQVTRLMVADHLHDANQNLTALSFQSYLPANPTTSPLGTHGGDPHRPRDLGLEELKMTSSGKILFTKITGTKVYNAVAGTVTAPPLDQARYYSSITDIPAGGSGEWGVLMEGSFMAREGERFENVPSAPGLMQFDSRGTGIGNGSPLRAVWHNGRWSSLARVSNLPATNFENMSPKKITSSGLIWVGNADGTENGVLIPVTVKDNAFATGVDDESLQADPGAEGYEGRFWVMVPAGSAPVNGSLLRSSLAPPSTIGFATAAASPSFVMSGGPDVDVPISWSDPGAPNSGDIQISAAVSGSTATGHPVALKVMKRRTVRILLQPIGYNNSTPIPDVTAIRARLHEIFGRQLNAWAEIELGAPIPYNADIDGDTMIDASGNEGEVLARKKKFFRA